MTTKLTTWTNNHIRELRVSVIVHSCMYYFFDCSVISDLDFDQMCQSLVFFHTECPDYTDELDRYFESFDGSTGFHLSSFCFVSMFSHGIYTLGTQKYAKDFGRDKVQWVKPRGKK